MSTSEDAMVTTTENAAGQEDLEAQVEAFVGRLFGSIGSTFEVATIYLGTRLGLYEAVRESGSVTASELASSGGIAERYAREWLEQQAVAGILTVADAAADPGARRYSLPSAHAEVLLNMDSPAYLAPLVRTTGALGATLPALLDAYRAGAGVAYARYGEDAREGQAGMNRNAYLQLLTTEWLPSLPDVDEKLRKGARLADIGCGEGWSGIAIARAYPAARVDGFDNDEASIAAARRLAEREGVGDRVRFEVRDAADTSLTGTYDVVTMFEALHDMGRPVDALRVAHALVGDGGTVLVMDERAKEAFAAPGDDIDRFFHAVSVTWCVPQGLADGPEPHGTVLRPSELEAYARRAGFSDVEVLPIENDFFRFYRLTP